MYPRYISSNDSDDIDSVMYLAEQGDDILLAEHAYATDRHVVATYPDTESHIYKLEIGTTENSVELRLAADKLTSGIKFIPYCANTVDELL